MDAYYYSILIAIGINIILASSLNLVNGLAGQFSMGHAGFMAVGAYSSAFLSILLKSHFPDIFSYSEFITGFVFLACLFIGGLFSAFTGYLVGLPSLRLKGDYLAIVTLGFGEIIRVVLLNINAVGGARGLPGIESLTSLSWTYFVVAITLFTCFRILNSPYGRAFLSVREDEIASASVGVDTTQAKVLAFVLGAFFAGMAGGLFAHFYSYINPASFDFNKSFDIIIMVVLGGMGSISGSIFAAAAITFMKEGLRTLQEITLIDFRMIVYSLLLILLMILKPNGLFGTSEIYHFHPINWLKKRYAKRSHSR